MGYVRKLKLMSFSIEDIQNHFPYYLTEDRKKGLLKALRDFPEKMNYYTSQYPNKLLQGDGIKNLTIYDTSGNNKKVQGILLSNSCDISPENQRDISPRVVFAPLIQLDKYRDILINKQIKLDIIENKISDIKNQRITNIFYLPKLDSQSKDFIVLLDDVYNVSSNNLPDIKESKTFTLSQAGFYIFLFKLSIHFCRLHENIDR